MLVKNFFDFDQLMNPICSKTFFEEYWENKPLLLSRDKSNYYQKLFSVNDVDRVLYFSRIKSPEIRVVENQQELLPAKYSQENGSINLNQIYKSYYEDHTLVINGLNQYWHPLAVFCSDLQNFPPIHYEFGISS